MMALGVAAVFGALGVLLDVPRSLHAPLPVLALYAVLMGVMAVGYFFAFVWDTRLLPVAIGLLVLVNLVGERADVPGRAVRLTPAALASRLRGDTVAVFALVVIGYVLLIRSIHGIARGHARLATEVELARGIHEALVPAVSGRSGPVEYFGQSRPSGAIGGDLVDAVGGPHGTTLYVIDVSGHGVRAGVLMAMLKSASRTALGEGASLPALLAHFNRTICELERPGLFATCAALQIRGAGPVEYALAGHPPIFLRGSRTGAVRELQAEGPPLGLDANARYGSATVAAGAGDQFLVVTDGLTEVFHKDGSELGLAGIRDAAFADGDGAPRAIVERVIAAAARFGRQLDDQTVLAIRLRGEKD
jgi:serine phosphatase RsbU (regulator of sigma subunit)